MALIKQNEETGSTELWIDGEFHASWGMVDIPTESKRIIESMTEYGMDHGKHLKAIEIQKVIGI
ncbi:MAG: hypothetical protein ABUJ92_00150 [Desulfobacterales bacterium]